MSSPVREDLLGYLLGALDADKAHEVERALEHDSALQRDLEMIRQRLEPLSLVQQSFPAPPDLAERTCSHVFSPQTRCLTAAVAEKGPDDDAELTRAEVGFGERRWSTADLIVVCGVCMAAFSILFPALFNRKQMALRTACERNLVVLGDAFSEYCVNNGGAYPEIPEQGNRAVAGIYVPILWNQCYINESGVLICPSSPQADTIRNWNVPTLEEIDQASGRTLVRLHNTMGGSYGYPLGFVLNGRLQAPLNRGRSYYPIIADAPSSSLPGLASRNHNGCGQNVLYEDNRVRFVNSCITEHRDEMFLNRQGIVAAGLDDNDAVIGRSGAAPRLPGVSFLPID